VRQGNRAANQLIRVWARAGTLPPAPAIRVDGDPALSKCVGDALVLKWAMERKYEIVAYGGPDHGLLPVALRVNRRRRLTSVRRPTLTMRGSSNLTILIEKCPVTLGQSSTPVRPKSWSNFNARLQPECHPFACNGPSAATRSATSFATRISDSTSFWSTSKSPSYSATLRLR
jgi:hypothetical protein